MRALILLLVLAAGPPGVASAQGNPADLDPDFGTGGISMGAKVSNRAETGHEVVRAPDGGYYAGGIAMPARPSFVFHYRSDGTRDTDWGNAGELTYPGDTSGGKWELAVDGQGRLVAGADVYLCPDGPASCSGRAALMRLTPEGAFDESFSGDGRLLLPEGETLDDVAVDGDGRILVGVRSGGGPRIFRLLSSGSVDDSFAASVLSHPAQKIVLHGDGIVVAAGWPDGGPYGGYALTRLGATGEPDAGFGPEGAIRHVVAAEEGGFGDLLALPDGRLIVGWGRLTLHAYLPDGRPDGAFGQDAVATADTGGAANGLAVDAEGRIVATVNGVAPAEGATSHFLLARFLPTGALDASFGTAGTAFGSFAPAYDSYAGDVLVDAAGRIVVVGTSGGDGQVHGVIAMARFRGGDAPLPEDETKTGAPPTEVVAPAVTPPTIVPPSPMAPTLKLSAPGRSKVRSRRFTVNAGYGAPAIVAARAVLRSGKRKWTVRSVSAAVDAGAPAALRLRLPAAAVRALRARQRVSALVTVKVIAEGATVATKAYRTRLHQ